MKLFLSFLRHKLGAILCFLFFAIVFAFTFSLFRLPLAAVWYPVALCAFLGIAILALEFRRVRQEHERLEKAQRLPAALISELPEPRSISEEDLQNVIKALQREISELETDYSKRLRDRMDYYTLWAHQIKTPISAMKLILQQEDSPAIRHISSELSRIEQYADMVMTFLRLEDGECDYVFRNVPLDSMIRQSVKRFSSEFIGRKISLVYDGIDGELLTDEKWFCFVLEQLLSNALKYTRAGSITIYSPGKDVLCIEDTGIGIAPENLPRIFDKGYTGYNGRIDQRASGIGLYLCKRVCDKLGVGISAESLPGEGTRMYLDISQQQIQAE